MIRKDYVRRGSVTSADVFVPLGEALFALSINPFFSLLTISMLSGRLYGNFTGQTVEAEITAMTTSQRARGDENRAGDALSNGPLRARGKGKSPSIPRRVGARETPGI